ncbi:MAG: epoxyqueuosine reductase QueH [Candidatus Omnitrophica bacterium]|nr:epoxyqueuosine reductase QueH [Candidatus Omnitrophota bacterium]
MKILLHTCCAPCLIYPLEILRENNFTVVSYFYNPNIHSYAEFEKRRQAVDSFAGNEKIDAVFPPYNPIEFFHAVYQKEIGKERCSICWRLRLNKTALAAKALGFEYFTTTMLVSPYQSQEMLKEIGEDIGRKEQVKFFYEDFRPGFRKSHDQAKAKGIYCQKYCGCIFSEIETCKK